MSDIRIGQVLFDITVASIPLVVGIAATWRLIWPRWKVAGKILAYLVGVAALSVWLGHWSILLGALHQGVGLGIHIWFSRRHGFTWYAVEDPERYVQLSKEMVGTGAASEGLVARDGELGRAGRSGSVGSRCWCWPRRGARAWLTFASGKNTSPSADRE